MPPVRKMVAPEKVEASEGYLECVVFFFFLRERERKGGERERETRLVSSKEEEGEKRERRERREEREREREERESCRRPGWRRKKTLAEKHVVSRFPCFRLHGKRPNSILFAT